MGRGAKSGQQGNLLAQGRGQTVLPKYRCAVSAATEKLAQFRCTNLRNPEAAFIDEADTQQMTLEHPDRAVSMLMVSS